MRYQVIAFDLDGTLLTPQKTILPESIAAINAARAAGYRVLLVTGRHHVAIRAFYETLALDTPAICCNGTYLYDYPKQRVLSSTPLPLDKTEATLALLEQEQINALLYVDNAMLYQRPSGHVTRTLTWAQSLPEAQRPTFIKVPSLRDAARQSKAIWKIALTDNPVDNLRHAVEQIEQRLELSCEWSWIDQVDIAEVGNSKGKRLADWIAAEGLTMDQVVAFGDNYNDLSMLTQVGLGIAMGNADDAVKNQVALSIGPNDRPSIAEAMYQHLL